MSITTTARLFALCKAVAEIVSDIIPGNVALAEWSDKRSGDWAERRRFEEQAGPGGTFPRSIPNAATAQQIDSGTSFSVRSIWLGAGVIVCDRKQPACAGWPGFARLP